MKDGPHGLWTNTTEFNCPHQVVNAHIGSSRYWNSVIFAQMNVYRFSANRFGWGIEPPTPSTCSYIAGTKVVRMSIRLALGEWKLYTEIWQIAQCKWHLTFNTLDISKRKREKFLCQHNRIVADDFYDTITVDKYLRAATFTAIRCVVQIEFGASTTLSFIPTCVWHIRVHLLLRTVLISSQCTSSTTCIRLIKISN